MPADAALCLADSILGTSLFSSVAPDDFGVFMRAFITMFRVASGKRRAQAPTARCCAYCVIFTALCSLFGPLQFVDLPWQVFKRLLDRGIWLENVTRYCPALFVPRDRRAYAFRTLVQIPKSSLPRLR